MYYRLWLGSGIRPPRTIPLGPLFPFFTFLLDNKKRGWMVLLLSLVFCYITIVYFGTPDFVVKPIDKVNIIYSAPFFISGGMIYLYRQGVKSWVEKH